MKKQFETQVLDAVTPALGLGGSAEFHNGTLFITGVMPEDSRQILQDLRGIHPKIRVSRTGSYQTDYTFAYDFV